MQGPGAPLNVAQRTKSRAALHIACHPGPCLHVTLLAQARTGAPWPRRRRAVTGARRPRINTGLPAAAGRTFPSAPPPPSHRNLQLQHARCPARRRPSFLNQTRTPAACQKTASRRSPPAHRRRAPHARAAVRRNGRHVSLPPPP